MHGDFDRLCRGRWMYCKTTISHWPGGAAMLKGANRHSKYGNTSLRHYELAQVS
jgi:hypothetical protein